jgi:DNA polymerase elongation subunit (family B)
VKTEGWLFDLYPTKSGRMTLWLKRRDGECTRLVDEWTPRIHIAGKFTDLLDLAARPEFCDRCNFVERFERPNDSSRSKVLEIKVSSDREATALGKKIQQLAAYGSKYRPYDVDISSSQMYLYQKNLFPLAYVEANNHDGRIAWNLLDSSNSTDYEVPPFRIAKLAVSTKTSNRVPTMGDPIDTITITIGDQEKRIDSGSETDKLLALVEAFNEFNPDIVRTDDGDAFIFPYLTKRAREHGVLRKLALGRDHAPLRVFEVTGRSYFSYGRIYYRSTAARLMGRLHLDYSNSFIDTDCGLEGLIEVARTCIIPLQRASRSTIGTSMSSLQIYHAIKRGIMIPWNKSQPEDFKDGNRLLLADRGGFIYEPKLGIHDWVGEIDFSSLYPTIMLKNNLSGETVNCECCSDSPNRVPEVGFHICERRQGIVPASLEVLLKKRAEYKRWRNEANDPPKRTRYDQRQAALKWILVCS